MLDKTVETPLNEETQKRIEEYIDYMNDFCGEIRWAYENAVYVLIGWGLDHVQGRVDEWKAGTSYGRILPGAEAEAPAAEESAEQPQADSGGHMHI